MIGFDSAANSYLLRNPLLTSWPSVRWISNASSDLFQNGKKNLPGVSS